MDDLISRQAAIRGYQEVCKGIKCGECPLLIKVNTEKGSHLITDCKLEAFLHDLPSADRLIKETVGTLIYTKGDDAVSVAFRNAGRLVRNAIDGESPEFEEIPSADRPTGEWVFDTQIPIGKGAYSAGYRCSICGRDYFRVAGMNFCPNCGADMRGEQDG